MLRIRRHRTLLWLALAATLGLAACSSSKDSTSGVELQGAASAVQFDIFLRHPARDWAWAGGQFDAPDDHATLVASAPPTFTWHADPADFAEAVDGGTAGEAVMTHLLLFSTPSNGDLLRVFTTLSEYTPDVAAWQKLVNARTPITLSLTTASFVGGELPDDGGPFIGQSLTFTIE